MTTKLRLLVLLVALQLSVTGSNHVGLLDLFDLSLANGCNETEYYDSSKLSCQKCPDNSVPVDKSENIYKSFKLIVILKTKCPFFYFKRTDVVAKRTIIF